MLLVCDIVRYSCDVMSPYCKFYFDQFRCIWCLWIAHLAASPSLQ